MMPALTRRAFTTTALSAARRARRAQQLDKVSFGTNWVAEAEHGGFYQAVADGTYRKYGLDVTIVPGGPQVNNRMLLLAGKIDFFMSAQLAAGLRRGGAEHPDRRGRGELPEGPAGAARASGRRRRQFEDLKKLTLFVSSEGLQTYFKWMQAEFGFRREAGEALHVQPAAVPGRQATARCRAT